jgi:hypothetical protein
VRKWAEQNGREFISLDNPTLTMFMDSEDITARGANLTARINAMARSLSGRGVVHCTVESDVESDNGSDDDH